MHLHTHRVVSEGTEGSCFPYDLDCEHANKYTVAWNQAHTSFESTVEFTGQVQAYKHVDQTYRKLTLQEIATPIEERPSFMAGVCMPCSHIDSYTYGYTGVTSLLNLFNQLVPAPLLPNSRNAFMGRVGGLGLKPHKCDERLSLPWQFLADVERGRSGPIGYGRSKRSAHQVAEFIEKNEKRFTGARLIQEGHLPPL